MEMLFREFKHSFRSLLRNKGYAAAVTVTLLACIAVNVAIFAIVESVLIRPLPVPGAEDIVLMSNEYPGAGVDDLDTSSSGDYYDRLEKVTALGEQAEFRFTNQTITLKEVAERERTMTATPSLFTLLRVGPLFGRTFTAAEGEVGAEQKVLLSYGLWQQMFGGDRNILGQPLRLNGVPFTIVGVMPPDFTFIDPAVRLWIPAAFTSEEKTIHHSNNWHNIGRLRPGASMEQVQAQVNALNAANMEKFPQMKATLANAGFHTVVEPLKSMVVKDVKSPLRLLWAGSVFVLLIGILNVANLAVARLSLRRKEFATRLALGAGRGDLMSQFAIENLILAMASAGCGVFLGAALLRAIRAIGLNHFPRAYEVGLNAQVIGYAALLTLGTCLLTSGLSLAGLSIKHFHAVLRDDDRTSSAGTKTRRVRQGLVVGQIGFAFALLVGAGLLLASFRELLRVNPGYRTAGVVTASIDAPTSKYPDGARLNLLMNRALDAVRQTPGVLSAGASTTVPLGGNYNDSVISAEGYAMKAGESVVSPLQLSITPGYLETMGVPLLKGRYFQESDNKAAPRVVLVDEVLAERFWPHRDPVGLRMYEPDPPDLTKVGPDTIWYTVVGVVRSVRLQDLSGKGNPGGAYYFPYAQSSSNSYSIAVRTNLDDARMAQAIRSQIATVDPELALFDVRTMAQATELSLSARRTSMLLAVGFGGLALFLAAIGIYAVLAYLVAQRRREIGIRVALGSTQGGIMRLVLREGLALVGIGLIVGVAASISLRSIVRSEVYGVMPMDPRVIGTVAVMFAVVALGACILPALRAMRVDPVTVLSER